jgi:predicted nucleotidyltransferase
MSTLSTLLSSKTRAEIFRLLFGLATPELHLRDIQRQTGLSISSLRQELDSLSRIGLVTTRRSGNRLYFRANGSHPLCGDIHNLVIKTSGLVDVLRERLSPDSIQLAFVFGSIAREDEAAHSDVDLMVIGRVTLRELTGLLSGVTELVGREINPHVLSIEELRSLRHVQDHFISSVLVSEKLFVKGTADDLAHLA